MKIYHYQCERCYFNIDNKERMKKHCLLVHGITGEFKKGFKTIMKYKKVVEPIKPKEEQKMSEKLETQVHKGDEIRWKRKYLRNGKQAPEGAKVFTNSVSGKQYYLKEIGKKNSYKNE